MIRDVRDAESYGTKLTVFNATFLLSCSLGGERRRQRRASLEHPFGEAVQLILSSLLVRCQTILTNSHDVAPVPVFLLRREASKALMPR